MRLASGFSWELQLAPSWSAQTDRDCESIVRADGLGALQISTARKDSDVTDDDLQQFAHDEFGRDFRFTPVKLGDFVGIELRQDFEGAHWRRWFVRHRDVILFATYLCEPPDKGKEDADVDRMLSTLRATDVRSH